MIVKESGQVTKSSIRYIISFLNMLIMLFLIVLSLFIARLFLFRIVCVCVCVFVCVCVWCVNFDIVISSTRYYHEYCNYREIHCSKSLRIFSIST